MSKIGMPNFQLIQQMMKQQQAAKPSAPQFSGQPRQAAAPQFQVPQKAPAANPAVDQAMAQVLKRGGKLNMLG